MLIDLSLKGKQVVVVGAGREAVRKVEALLPQECEIIVVADRIADAIRQWEKEKKLTCRVMIVEGGEFLKDYEHLFLLMAVTDSKELNRALVEVGRRRGCYVYAVDDSEVSDFSHPSVISLGDTVQVAITTCGKSPLMARTFRERLEPLLRQHITQVDLLQVQLQDRMRRAARDHLNDLKKRKDFLQSLLRDPEIQSCLERGDLADAEFFARQRLQNFEK